MPLDPQVAQTVDAYLAQAGDLVEGLYLYGSVALDDFRPGLSDIDFVAVIGKRLDSATVSKSDATARSSPR